MHGRQGARDARRAGEFRTFVSGAGGRLLHTATLLTAEHPEHNPHARRLLTVALARTYADWDGLRGEDPYARVRQQLAVRFARSAWRRHRGGSRRYVRRGSRRHDLWDALGTVLRDTPWGTRRAHPGHPARPGGLLEALAPQERLVLVLRMYEGVAEEQTAALLGLPPERIRAVCARAMSTLLHPPPRTAPQPLPDNGSVALGTGRSAP